jgi:hypothetical protein
MAGFVTRDLAIAPAAAKHSAPRRQHMPWLDHQSLGGYPARNCLHPTSAVMVLGCSFVANAGLRFVAFVMESFMV